MKERTTAEKIERKLRIATINAYIAAVLFFVAALVLLAKHL